MTTDSLTLRARELWRELAAAPVTFEPGRVDVVVSPGSKLCPPGWVGIVAIGDAAIATAPSEAAAKSARTALAALAIETVTEESAVRRVLQVRRVLGPAALAYVDAESFRPVRSDVTETAADDPGIAELKRLSGEDDAGEASLDEITSPAFVIHREGTVAAASGYRRWPARTVHIGVLTAPRWRGQGLAKAVGSAATAHALAAGLLPQWRARIQPSRRAALALGFRELGAQLSVELG